MAEKQPKPELTPEFIEKWNKAVEAQHWVATHPRSQEEAEEFHRKITAISAISAISALELFQEMNI